jgi:hypothetical protein
MKMNTNKTKLLIAALAAIGIQLINTTSGHAQEFDSAFVSAVSISTNLTGLTYHELDNRDLIRHCASEQGITNLTGLHLVYDRTADAVEVVHGTNNTLICTPLAFSNATSLSNTNGTKIQRFAWVSWEGSTVANGTLVAYEQINPATTNHPASFNLRGQLQFNVPASGTNPPVIYIGSINAGSPSFELGDFDHED